jgi:hypothetical protein
MFVDKPSLNFVFGVPFLVGVNNLSSVLSASYGADACESLHGLGFVLSLLEIESGSVCSARQCDLLVGWCHKSGEHGVRAFVEFVANGHYLFHSI